MFVQHQLGSNRISELLENLGNEFETLARDVNMFKLQRDDYERKSTPLFLKIFFLLTSSSSTKPGSRASLY